MTVLVTRAQEQAREFCNSLTEAGAHVVELPVLEIKEPDDWSAFDTCISKSVDMPYDWVIFASQNAVKATWQRLTNLERQQHFTGTKVASVGAATTRLLNSLGLKVDFEPSSFVADTLASELIHNYNVSNQRILLPRADIGKKQLGDSLTQAGALVDSVVVYQTTLPAADSQSGQKIKAVTTLLQQGSINYITVASSQSVRNLAMLLKNDLSTRGSKSAETGLVELLAKTKVIAIGPVTAQTALEELGQAAHVAQEHTAQGMLQAILTVLKFPKKAV